MNIPEITPERFYKWGFYLLGFNACWSVLTLFANITGWVYYYWWSIFPDIGGTLFSCLLASFFYFLMQTMKPSMNDKDFLKQFG